MNIKQVKENLEILGIRPSKKLGQNFLINEKIALDITEHIQKSLSPWVEIGPGLGSLTKFFDTKKDKIYLIEKDKKLISYWEEKGFSIFCADALKFDWNQLPKPFTLFGNLPYQIAGSLILEMSLFEKPIHSMIFMIQKEVGERIIAKPKTKNYGILSVTAQTFWTPRLLFSAHKKDFYPIPEVNAWVLDFKPQSATVSALCFLKFVKIAFAHRRKKLITQLYKELPFDWKSLFEKQNWSSDLRAEELSPSQFQSLYKEFKHPQ